MAKIFLCKVADVESDTLKELTLGNGDKVCVMNSGGTYYACQPYCPHEGIPLCEGCIDGTTLTCLEHLWQWDVRSGEPMGLAERPLAMLDLERDGEAVYLKG
jgi:toluene monooxygenase system ferredoxin subunit